MTTRSIRLLALGLCGLAALWPLVRSSSSPAEAPKKAAPAGPDFKKEVLPILQSRCLKCHGAGKGRHKTRGGLSLLSRTDLLKGGDLGPAISVERPETSRFLHAINYDEGLEMPPSGKLPAGEIAVLTRWVKAGAPWPGGEIEPVGPALKGMQVTDADRAYWAYRLLASGVPAVKEKRWVRNPIDAFVLAKLEEKGLAPAPPADRVALVRRAYYDLLGLPPTPEEVEAFVNDPSPTAYERLIDQLLASPHYGEKWGRHWLDVVRYAETNGYEGFAPKLCRELEE